MLKQVNIAEKNHISCRFTYYTPKHCSRQNLYRTFWLLLFTSSIPAASNTLPSYFRVYYPESSFLPYINFNEDSRTGFDLALNYKKDFGKDFGMKVGLNLTHYTTNAAKRDDTNFADEYQYREGKPLDAIWGYECLGFFKDEDDIANSPVQKLGATVRPGDLKYKDQNGDGIIDTKDQVNLGKAGWYGAPTTLGINLTFKYKNFTLFMLGVGSFGGHAMKSNSYGKMSKRTTGLWARCFPASRIEGKTLSFSVRYVIVGPS